MESKKQDISMKLLLLGDQAVGKSSLILRYTQNEFNFNIMGTAGLDLKKKNVVINNDNVKVTIYDSAGHERFRNIAKNHYKNSDGIIIIYDVTDKKTFENVTQWINSIHENVGSEVQIMLVGNKIDMTNHRQVQTEEGLQLSQKFNSSFMETSAKTGENVEETFLKIIQSVYNKIDRNVKQQGVTTNNVNIKKKSNKCC